MQNDYQKTIEWLYKKLPMFQRIGASAYKEDLGNIMALCQHLGNPQDSFSSIHIAGTNGKGSTAHMLASVLQEAGYKTGLTTSPHLKDFRERIRVNGELCSRSFVIQFVEENSAFIEQLEASFFEVSIAMAFSYFEKKNVDLAVIETGLGGRLDSTNIINPILTVITNIGLDHTGILGSTLKEIATEKAGIIKTDVPVIVGESHPDTVAVFKQKATALGSEIIFADEQSHAQYPSDLKGLYQIKNQKTVLSALQELRKLGYVISEEATKIGLQNVRQNTGLRGRWDVLQTNPIVVADTAHNTHGIKEVIRQIKETPHEKLHLVLGFVNDKDVLSILELFPTDAIYYFSAPDVPRKLPISELEKIVPENLNARYFTTVAEALLEAKTQASPKDLVYVGGSTFVVAEVV